MRLGCISTATSTASCICPARIHTPYVDGNLRTTQALGVYGNRELNLHPIAASDIDRNSAKDLLAPVGYPPAGTVRLNTVLANPPSRGNGFQPTQFTSTLNNPAHCAVGDLNRDGRPDVVTTSIQENPGVAVHLNTGNGVLGAKTTLSQAYLASSVQLADLNRDGILDIVASAHVFTTRIFTMLGVGDGTFGPRQDLLMNVGIDFEIGDMNRDGIPDVMTALADSIRVLIGNGNGTFTPGSKVHVAPPIYDVELADLDRDGDLDVAVAAGAVHVVYGNANGTLGTRTTLPAPITSCQTLSVADFNRDGLFDIQANDANVFYVMWGSQSAPYGTWATTTMPYGPFNVEVGEAEGNGEPYLYVTRNLEWLEIVKVAPSGSLTPVGSYPITASPLGLALGDMDRDGILDAVTVGSEGSFVSVTLHGTNTVTSVEPVSPAAGPLAVLAQNAPNPFNPKTDILFALREEDQVRLTVHDVHGRVVAVLVEGVRPAGSHRVPWAGRNDHGAAVASGVYFYRLTTGKGFQATKRMVLVK